MALHLVPTEPQPEEPAKRARRRIASVRAPAMLQCPRCGCRETIETKTGVLLVNGKARGGTKSLVCADCHRRGERVVVL